MSSRLKKVRARRGAATLGRFETAPRLVRRATRSRSDSPRVHRRDLGFDEYGAQTRTLSARPKVARRRPARPLQDGYARRRPAPSRPRGAKGLRSADQRGLVRGMGGRMSRPHPLERRHRRHGQSVEPQGTQSRATHKGGRSRTAISAALQPRHEPDRKGLFQAEGLPAQNRRTNRRGPADRPRRHCQSRFYTACSRTRAGWSSTVFAHESPTGSAGFDAENGLFLFALTVPFCGLVGTLIADEDGVYDPRLANDRLLLGMKGTMSEMELSILRQRAHEALKQKARRGELFTTVVIGY